MTSASLADFSKLLTPHLSLSKTCLGTLCLIVLGMISARTVNQRWSRKFGPVVKVDSMTRESDVCTLERLRRLTYLI